MPCRDGKKPSENDQQGQADELDPGRYRQSPERWLPAFGRLRLVHCPMLLEHGGEGHPSGHTRHCCCRSAAKAPDASVGSWAVSDRSPQSQRLPAFRPARSPLVSMGPSLVEQQRSSLRRRLLLLGSVAVLIAGVAITVMMRSERATRPVLAVPVTGAQLSAGPPEPLALSRADDITLQLPIVRSHVSAIGYYEVDESDAITLEPQGRKANVSALSRALRRFFSTEPGSRIHYYVLGSGRGLNAVSVGAQPGTDVYAPISGTVVALAAHVVDGQKVGTIVQLQPLGDAETIVVARHIEADESLTVGQTVSAGVTLLGKVVELDDESVRQPLEQLTNGQGEGVQLQVVRSSPELAPS